MPPADCYFYEHVPRTLARLGLELPRHAVEAPSINIQFGMVMHAGLLGFGMRSQVSFAPGKDFLVRLPFELPFSGGSVGAVTLKSHALSPLAELLIGHIRDLANPPPALCGACRCACHGICRSPPRSRSHHRFHVNCGPPCKPSAR